MSEQPSQPSGSQDQGSPPGPGADVARAGGGRTAGETTVDEAMGAEDEPTS